MSYVPILSCDKCGTTYPYALMYGPVDAPLCPRCYKRGVEAVKEGE